MPLLRQILIEPSNVLFPSFMALSSCDPFHGRTTNRAFECNFRLLRKLAKGNITQHWYQNIFFFFLSKLTLGASRFLLQTVFRMSLLFGDKLLNSIWILILVLQKRA